MDVTALLVGLAVGLAAGIMIGWAFAQARAAETRARMWAAEEKAAYVETQLTERFQAISTRVLDATHVRFLELAESRLNTTRAEAAGDLDQRRQAIENLVEPLRETLAKVEDQLRDSAAGARAARAELAQQLEFVRRGSEQLSAQTAALVRALQRPEARGRWGELQLRRVAEIAGMARFCDFDEQVATTGPDGQIRPDMVVRLAGDRSIVVDAKVSLAAYLEAAQGDDPEVAATRLDAHARHLREHVDRLAAKSYWQAFSSAPEFVVLFIPGEAFLAPALERDPGLLEYAMKRRVHIATPTTLITMLRTAQYAWQQTILSENARAVFELGKEIYERLGTLGRHMHDLGGCLSRTLTAYNRAVGSLESRLLVSARRMHDLGLADAPLDPPRPITEAPRPVTMVEADGQEQASPASPARANGKLPRESCREGAR